MSVRLTNVVLAVIAGLVLVVVLYLTGCFESKISASRTESILERLNHAKLGELHQRTIWVGLQVPEHAGIGLVPNRRRCRRQDRDLAKCSLP